MLILLLVLIFVQADPFISAYYNDDNCLTNNLYAYQTISMDPDQQGDICYQTGDIAKVFCNDTDEVVLAEYDSMDDCTNDVDGNYTVYEYNTCYYDNIGFKQYCDLDIDMNDIILYGSIHYESETCDSDQYRKFWFVDGGCIASPNGYFSVERNEDANNQVTLYHWNTSKCIDEQLKTEEMVLEKGDCNDELMVYLGYDADTHYFSVIKAGQCMDGYYGESCNVYECGGGFSNETICNGHGSCTPGTDCVCSGGYSGDLCETAPTDTDVASLVTLVFFLFMSVVLL